MEKKNTIRLRTNQFAKMASYIQTLQESLNCTIKLAVHTVHLDISNPSQLKPGIFAI